MAGQGRFLPRWNGSCQAFGNSVWVCTESLPKGRGVKDMAGDPGNTQRKWDGAGEGTD